jgi:hypothetical protein
MPDSLSVHLIAADLLSNALEFRYQVNFELINDDIEGNTEKTEIDHEHMSSLSNRDKKYLNWDEKMEISLGITTARSVLRLTLFKKEVVTSGNQSVYAQGDILICPLHSPRTFLNGLDSLSVSEIVSNIHKNLRRIDCEIELKITSSKDKSNPENETPVSTKDSIREAEDFYHDFLDAITSNITKKTHPKRDISPSALNTHQSNIIEGELAYIYIYIYTYIYIYIYIYIHIYIYI